MLILDIFLYLFFAWYFDAIIPNNNGVSKKWYFIFQLFKTSKREEIDTELTKSSLLYGTFDNSKISIENVTKIFTTGMFRNKKTVTALNSVSLTLSKGEIFGLLGLLQLFFFFQNSLWLKL